MLSFSKNEVIFVVELFSLPLSLSVLLLVGVPKW